MAPKVDKEKKPVEAKKADASKDGSKPKRGRARNYDLGNGVYRFSRSAMYQKKALWKFIGKKTAAKPKPKKRLTIEKPIGGDKNGKTRIVPVRKPRKNYPTMDKIRKRHGKTLFSEHKRKLKPSLTPGTICIMLTGTQKGKRVVFLKQLKSGFLLVNGPYKVNACPLRRMNQRYVIATATKLDISGVTIPEHIDDAYFRRNKKRAKKEEKDIFATKKEAYKPTEQRRADQAAVDKLLLDVIKKHPEKKAIFGYLRSMWRLRSSQYPHRMHF